MIPRIFAYLRHNNGVIDDMATQLSVVAKKIDASAPLTALVTGFGPKFDEACDALRAIYQEVWKVSHPALEHANPESVGTILPKVLPKGSVVLLAHDHFGMDVGPWLSIKLNGAYVGDIINVEHLEGSTLRIICQEFGGQFHTHVACQISSGAVITVRPGVFKAGELVPLSGVVVNKSLDLPTAPQRRLFIGLITAPPGDLDITKFDVLVSVGRGIQKPENISIAEELAEQLGAAVSCSRPVVDAKWLDKSRQVGTSGATVKPKVYLACGISGQFQHLAGLKGNPFIIAVNKNPQAPIFQAADVGVVADILEFLPELTNKVREAKAGKLVVGAQ
jgi:electron transfer flavoprotein alpha subunit